jgi:N-formylglutamate amidohydrolase
MGIRMTQPSYRILRPTTLASSVIFASPHSGRDYSRDFLRTTVLNAHSIRSSEDAFVDDLFAAAPKLGAPLLLADVPRAYVDLNRAAEEWDPALIDGHRATIQNPRIASGLGVIPRVVANGRAIYRGKLTAFEVQRRLDAHWHPYHRAVQSLLDEAHAACGEAILIDCHSMPHEAVDGVARAGLRRPDVVLGDRFGASAGADVMERIESALTRAGLTVSRNAPFAGAYTAQHYGRPSRRQHVVQIEIDRSLYMNELEIRPNAHFETFRHLLTDVIADMIRMGARPKRHAAE